MESSQRAPWEKSPHAMLPKEMTEDLSTQDTLRTRNESHDRKASSIGDIFPDLKLPQEVRDATTQVASATPSESSSTRGPRQAAANHHPQNSSNNMAPPNHRRTTSALKSEGLPCNKPTHGHHNRQVSWDLNNNTHLEIETENTRDLHVPRLSETDFTLTDGTNVSISNLPYFRPKRGGSGRISLDDLRNTRPMEAEADRYLIEALEKRESFVGNADSEPSAAVLSNIPKEDLEALRPDPENNSTGSPGTRSNQSHKGGGTINRNGTGDESEGSRRSTRQLFRDRSTRAEGGAPPTRHRRTETVGDKLESLAAAMDIVHMKNLDFLLEVEQHSDSMLPPPMQDTNDFGAEDWNGAADALQQNANLLFNRHRAQTEEQHDEEMAQTAALLSPVTAQSETDSVHTAASKWKLGRNTVLPSAPSSPGRQKINLSDINPAEDEETGEVDTNALPSSKTLDDSGTGGTENQEPGKKPSSFKARPAKSKFVMELEEFFVPRRKTIFYFLRNTIFFIILPCMGLAAVLFYFAGNPPTGKVDLSANTTNASGGFVNQNGDSISEETASASWWLLFIGVRQVLIFVLAKGVELFLIDFLSVRSRFSVKVLGPWGTLFLLQTKGWPFLLAVWGILNFALLSGTKPFFHHWLYWQDYIDLFNENNPSGEVVSSVWHHRVVAISLSLGCIVSVKRFWLGLHLGRQTFSQYSEKLANVMKKILLVSEVSSLGRAFERQIRDSDSKQKRTTITAETFGLNQERFEVLMNALPDDSTLGGGYAHSEAAEEAKRVIDPDDRHPLTGSLTQAQKTRIIQLLGQFEEPTIADERSNMRVSVNELLQFRRALEFLNTAYPFSGSFGLADRRESTITSAQEVYERLLLRSPDPYTVHFEVIALLGVLKNGQLDQDKLKDLIKLFRPDRDGSIECIDFVKAVDSVYKELRLLRASVANSSKIDQAFERIFNFIFYGIVTCIILSQIGYDPLALFLSISGVILGFAFMIGSASSKYFEGLLFILVRRPFQIGDGIALSDVNVDTPGTGSAHWIVEDVDLFTTKLVYLFSGERATVNNGSLANCRVINSTESKNAWLYIFLKFPVSVSFEKLQIFHQALEQFFKNRPREWLSFTQFRATRVEADQGFIEYIVIAQHRLPWVQWADLHQSKADLMHFSMELSKKLDIWYKSPPLPVDLSVMGGNLGEGLNKIPATLPPTSPASNVGVAPDLTELQNQFRPQLDWQR